jgi:hypothetical protein
MEKRTYGSAKFSIEIDPETGEQIDSGWRIPLVKGEAERRERRGKMLPAIWIALFGLLGSIAFLFYTLSYFFQGEFLYALGLLLVTITCVVSGIVGVFMTWFIFKDTKLIPDEPIHFPKKIKIVKNEEWRKPTNISELENVKKTIEEYENREQRLYDQALKAAAEDTAFVSGYFDYEKILKKQNIYNEFKKEFERVMPSLKDRAERLFRGDISRELVEIQSEIKQLELMRNRLTGDLKATELKLNECQEIIKRAIYQTEIKNKKEKINRIDSEIIDCNRRIDALKASNKGDLIQTIDAPITALQIPTEDLADLGSKLDFITTYPVKGGDTATNKESIKAKIEELRIAKKEELAKLDLDDEEERLRIANLYDDLIKEKSEELMEYL